MDTFQALLDGFQVAFSLRNLLFAFIGVTLGTAVGILPGIGPALTVALLLPVTFSLDPIGSFIMFAGIYYGGMYGGSTTSILLNTPGESASIITAIEGHKMAQKGRGAAALATAAIGSFIAGAVATVGLTFVAPVMVQAALRFGPADYFALMVLAFTTVTAVLGSSLLRGMTSLLFGIGLGLMGIDVQTGQARYTFGLLEMLDGISVVIVAVGLFAVGETIYVASRQRRSGSKVEAIRGSIWMNREEWSRSWRPWIRGAFLGFPLGSLPAGGAEIPTFLSYAMEKRLSRKPEEFGEGAIEGVAGPEAANNAAAAGVLVPLLTLGIPTSATAAIMLAAFQQFGLQPGPLLFQNAPDLVWGMIASLYLGNVMLLVLNLPLVGIWVRLLTIPRPLLYAGILLFASLGTYSLANSQVDLMTLLLIGLVGFLMRRFSFPVAPAVIGMILGPLAEQQFRRALAISQGDYLVFFERPISLTLLIISALALLLPPLITAWARRRAESSAA